MDASAIGGLMASACITRLFDKVCSFAGDQYEYQRDDAKDKLKRLRNSLWKIEAVVRKAESLQTKNPSRESWLGSIKDVAYQAEDVLDLFDYRDLQAKAEDVGKVTTNLFDSATVGSSSSTTSATTITTTSATTSSSSKVKRVVKRSIFFDEDLNELISIVDIFDKIATEMKTFLELVKLEDRRPEQPAQWRKTTSMPGTTKFFGRVNEEKRLKNLLMQTNEQSSQPYAVISVVGIAGVGKTALVQRVYSHFLDTIHFDFTAWLHVSDKFDLERLNNLSLCWNSLKEDIINTEHEGVFEGLRPNRNLKELHVASYMGTKSPTWLTKEYVSNIHIIELVSCHHWKTLPPFGSLPFLRILKIRHLTAVEKIDAEFYGDTAVAFPSLEELLFEGMDQWKEWSSVESSPHIFPRLCDINIRHCKKLMGPLPLPLPLSGIKISLSDRSSNIISSESEKTTEVNTSFGVQLFLDPIELLFGCLQTSSLATVHVLDISSYRLVAFNKDQEEWLQQLTSVKEVRFTDCPKLTSLPSNMIGLTSLVSLYVEKCPELVPFPPQRGLPLSLKKINGQRCSQINIRNNNTIRQGIERGSKPPPTTSSSRTIVTSPPYPSSPAPSTASPLRPPGRRRRLADPAVARLDDSTLHVAASCDGLLILSTADSLFFICNLATRQFRSPRTA